MTLGALKALLLLHLPGWCISSHVVPAHAFGKLRVASFNCDPMGMNPIPEQYQNKPAEDLTRPGPRPGEFSIYLLIVWELLL